MIFWHYLTGEVALVNIQAFNLSESIECKGLGFGPRAYLSEHNLPH